MSTDNPRLFRPILSSLEAREVPAITSVSLSFGVLTVRTDNTDNVVYVSQNPSIIQIGDAIENRVWNFSPSQVNRIDVFTGNGDDVVTNRGSLTRLTKIYTRGGDDVVKGGKGRDVIEGGAGNDRLYGRDGNDYINGGGGDDMIAGGNGIDNLKGGGENDTIVGGQGIDNISGEAGNDTVVSIDGDISDVVDAGSGDDVLWVDRNSAGIVEGTAGLDPGDLLRIVAEFTNGADLTLDGDRLPDPALINATDQYEQFSDRPLFADGGPTLDDVLQSFTLAGLPPVPGVNLDDSWLLGTVGAMVDQDPTIISRNLVDLGDGTYAVLLDGNFYRVDDDLPVSQFGNLETAYAGVGNDDSIWVPILEKAYTLHISNQTPAQLPPDYALLDNGGGVIPGTDPVDVFDDFEATASATISLLGFFDTDQLSNFLLQRQAAGDAVSVTINTAPATAPLAPGQTYTLVGLTTDAFGVVTFIQMRNPMGIDAAGADPNPNDGLVTVDINDLLASTGAIHSANFA